MTLRTEFDKIDLHLIRVLHTLIIERSVSRAALRLHSSQPAVSAQLKRLRELTGDPLLVRAGNGMTPTAFAQQMLAPAANLLDEADRLFSQRTRRTGFDPQASTTTFRIAASDFIDPGFLPQLVLTLKQRAPQVKIELLTLSSHFDYRRSLAQGEVDLVIGNWLTPPGELHLGRLVSDDVVCLVADDHPIVRAGVGRAWTVERYLSCEHVAPMPNYEGARGVIDDHLVKQGLLRDIAVRSAHFALIPSMVAGSRLVLTTGRLFCQRYVDVLPVRIVRCPVVFPPLAYYQLWHDLTHESASVRWLRECVRDVARSVAAKRPPVPAPLAVADGPRPASAAPVARARA